MRTSSGTRRSSDGLKVKKSHSTWKKTSKLQKTRPKASSSSVRRRMQVTRRRDTPGEIALRKALHAAGLRYRVDVSLPGTRRRPDVVLTRMRIAVFVDGCFWHGCPEHGTWPTTNAAWWRSKIQGNRLRDHDTDQRLRASGWVVLRFWAHVDSAEAARAVVNAVKSRTKRVTMTARSAEPQGSSRPAHRSSDRS